MITIMDWWRKEDHSTTWRGGTLLRYRGGEMGLVRGGEVCLVFTVRILKQSPRKFVRESI